MTAKTLEDENPMDFGIINKNGTVIGTYLHRFLNSNSLCQALLSYINKNEKLITWQNSSISPNSSKTNWTGFVIY